jgi:hypothetical protein
MRLMIRQAVLGLAVAVALVGCASRSSSDAKSAARPPGPQFATQEQKELACLDLRDHIVALYADEYVEQQGLEMTKIERDAFRSGWAEELAKKGTFDRFEQSCFFSLTPRKYQCGMASHSTDGLSACMKLSAL